MKKILILILLVAVLPAAIASNAVWIDNSQVANKQSLIIGGQFLTGAGICQVSNNPGTSSINIKLEYADNLDISDNSGNGAGNTIIGYCSDRAFKITDRKIIRCPLNFNCELSKNNNYTINITSINKVNACNGDLRIGYKLQACQLGNYDIGSHATVYTASGTATFNDWIENISVIHQENYFKRFYKKLFGV